MGHYLLPEPGSILARAAEFVEVGEVLRAAGGLLCEDEVGFAEVENREFIFLGRNLVFPRLDELKAGDRREEVNLARRHSEIELRPGSGEVRLRHADHRDSKPKERPHEFAGVCGIRLQPDIDVFGISRLGMMNHGIATSHKIADLTLG